MERAGRTETGAERVPLPDDHRRIPEPRRPLDAPPSDRRIPRSLPVIGRSAQAEASIGDGREVLKANISVA